MNCVGGGSVFVGKTPLNILLARHSSVKQLPLPRPYASLRSREQKPRTLLSGSFNADVAGRQRKRSSFQFKATSADADGPIPNDATANAESPTTENKNPSSTSLEISTLAGDATATTASSSEISPPSDDPEQPKRKKPSTPPRNNDSWLGKLAAKLKPGTSIRFVLNVLAFMVLLRIFPMPGVSNSPLSQPDGVVLRITFSEFVKSVRRNEIARVVVDGNHLSYALQPTSQIFTKGALKDVAFDQRKITFETTRPTDWPTPYETMLANGVQISAVEKKGGILSTMLVRNKQQRQQKILA
jgi:hypothetical protein